MRCLAPERGSGLPPASEPRPACSYLVEMIRSPRDLLVRGAAAGALGTLALSAWEPLRDGWLGHAPPYSVRNIATLGARRAWGLRLPARRAQRLGLLARWLYGPSLGVLYAALRASLPPRLRGGGLLLGVGVGVLEQLTFPLLRITRPPRTWSRAEHALLALQVLLYGVVTEAVLARLPDGARLRRRAAAAAAPAPARPAGTARPTPARQ